MTTETAVDVVMPQMGVSVSEGTVTRWLKQEGEQVEADEPLLEISTDKVDTEVPSPASGTVTQILVQEGQTVAVGTKIAQIGEAEGEAFAEPAPVAPAAPEPAHEEVEAIRAAPEEPLAPQEPPIPQEPPAAEPATLEAAAPETAPPAPALVPSGNGKPFVSPVVARIASQHGVDPSQIEGTGRGGRVTKKDILAFVEAGSPATAAAPATPEATATPPAAPPPPAQPAAAAAAPPSPALPPPAPPAPAPPAQASPPGAAEVAEPAGETLPGEVVEPVTAMRRGIADHMRRSLDTAAHVTSAIEVDMSRVVGARQQLKQEYQAAYGVNPTYLAFVAKATVETLRDFPYVNGELRGESIVTRAFVNLGIAVELADGKGLIVPVIRNAETLNLLGLAKGISDIAARARSKQLTPDDVQGGTFTITNPGGYGTFHGTPIISQPQSAILGTYALVKRPWVVEDELGGDTIAIRPIMNVTLTYDHRLVDGAYAGRFLHALRERLEAWEGDGD
jgi:pyruvate dehydrogenase E2 component (dihydrolipoamide acetyltransferase)